jgi:bifunctional UDP-N-acetylglucosamine pyrophosphorylase/glucosamine-1-phosphate N-acetyltransferase
VVVGHEAGQVRDALARHPGLTFVVQEPQLGTAHALLATAPAFEEAAGTLVLLSGDVPLLREATLKSLVNHHGDRASALTVLTALLDHPHGYGRIVRDGQTIARIVEEKDASSAERSINEINTGIYAFELAGLFEAVRGIAAENAQGEYYLPDLVDIYRRRGRVVETMTVPNPSEILGINSRSELAAINRRVRDTKNAQLMADGVTLEDPATTYIDSDVQIGPDTVIHPGVHLEGRTAIGAACEIHSGTRIVDSTIGDRTTILNHCVLTNVTVAGDVSIGPFAHLRNETAIGDGAKVGNFVEMKKSRLGAKSKANHLTYLGDADVGERTNIGAGTITCNYDGKNKHPTVIEHDVKIG